MPPRAMRVSVWRSISSARASPVRFQTRRRNSQVIGWGNLGAWPRPPSRSSNSPDEALDRRRPVRPSVSSAAPSAAQPLGLAAASRRAARPASSTSPRRRDRRRRSTWSRRGKRGHAVPVLRREVGAAVERHAVRREEHGHRPAAAAGHGLHGLHVDLVDVGPLLAVDLDVDEEAVHERGDLVVLERLALHDVAPVAGRVADREQHRLVLAAGRSKASSPHGYQSTGLWACWSRYGLVSEARRFAGWDEEDMRESPIRRAGPRRTEGRRRGPAARRRHPPPSTAVPGSKCSRRT